MNIRLSCLPCTWITMSQTMKSGNKQRNNHSMHTKILNFSLQRPDFSRVKNSSGWGELSKKPTPKKPSFYALLKLVATTNLHYQRNRRNPSKIKENHSDLKSNKTPPLSQGFSTATSSITAAWSGKHTLQMLKSLHTNALITLVELQRHQYP